MHLADYLRGRKYKIKCRSCGRVFTDEKELKAVTHIQRQSVFTRFFINVQLLCIIKSSTDMCSFPCFELSNLPTILQSNFS